MYNRDGPVIFEQWCYSIILNGAKTIFYFKLKMYHINLCMLWFVAINYHFAYLLTHLCHHGWIVIIKEIKTTVLILSFTQVHSLMQIR